MDRAMITFRLDAAKKKALDAIALSMDRDRSFVLNEAVKAYLEIYQWQIEHIQEGVRQADAKQFVSPKEVNAAFRKWRR